jgi:capsid protein
MLILLDFEKTPQLREMEIDVGSLRRLQMLACYEESEPARREIAKVFAQFVKPGDLC